MFKQKTATRIFVVRTDMERLHITNYVCTLAYVPLFGSSSESLSGALSRSYWLRIAPAYADVYKYIHKPEVDTYTRDSYNATYIVEEQYGTPDHNFFRITNYSWYRGQEVTAFFLVNKAKSPVLSVWTGRHHHYHFECTSSCWIVSVIAWDETVEVLVPNPIN